MSKVISWLSFWVFFFFEQNWEKSKVQVHPLTPQALSLHCPQYQGEVFLPVDTALPVSLEFPSRLTLWVLWSYEFARRRVTSSRSPLWWHHYPSSYLWFLPTSGPPTGSRLYLFQNVIELQSGILRPLTSILSLNAVQCGSRFLCWYRILPHYQDAPSFIFPLACRRTSWCLLNWGSWE